uniref:aminoglycoside phosphotransferase family protein n=1 Tax=Spirillospora albida TaxID=58123 RepID=UPI0014702863
LRSTPSTWTGSKQRRSARRSPSVSCPESAGPLTYRTRAAAETAARNHAWISGLGQLAVPALLHQNDRQLVFAHIPGRHVTRNDLSSVAGSLARFHVAAHRRLHDARTNEDHPTGRGAVLTGFAEQRERRLLQLLASSPPPETWLTPALVRAWILHAADLPAAVYKDANIRNFLLTPTVVAVDFDIISLAPLGYDLAKLVVSAAMTYGPLDTSLEAKCLNTYNEHLSAAGLRICTGQQFLTWAEMNHVLTSPYIGRNGYRFPGHMAVEGHRPTRRHLIW